MSTRQEAARAIARAAAVEASVRRSLRLDCGHLATKQQRALQVKQHVGAMRCETCSDGEGFPTFPLRRILSDTDRWPDVWPGADDEPQF